MDIAIINTWLITFKGKGLGIIPNGSLGIEDGLISFIGKSSDLNHKKADRIIDGTNHITMPGLINSHAHTGFTLLRGGAQDLPEIEWMNKGIGPLARYLKKEDNILGSKLAVLEGLRSGTTTFAEYAGNVSSLVQEVYLPLKVRVVAIETINEVSSDRAHLKPRDLYEFDGSKGSAALKKANNLFQEFKGTELVSVMYGPQALDFCSLDLLTDIKQQAKDRNCNIHMHVAQGERERLQIQGRFGADYTTVKILEKNGLLEDNLVAAHIHDTSKAERSLMVKKRVKMVGCPTSIAVIDGIVPPIGHYVKLGGIAALGTDQAPGPGHYNMFQEIRMASILTKINNNDPTALPPWQSLQLSTIGGAVALDLKDNIGCLEVGKRADIITIDLEKLNMTPIIDEPFRNLIPNLIYSSTGKEVDNVIISGNLILADDQFLNIDEYAIINEANKRAKEIFREASEEWIKAGSKMVSYHKDGFL
ncbi:MAG: amidohydrolase family protein [Candidatus Heimdallarchaeota archaeon]|nr:MAG: amidohydrolase family protein [Candidatus Heimdallarchaeota archaeon]